MSDEGQESEETVEEQQEVAETTNYTKESAASAGSDSDVEGNTNDAINASLEDVNDPAVLKSMIARLRHENGNARRKNKENAEEVNKLQQWKLNHNKTAKEATERAERAEEIARQYVIKAAAVEYDVDEDLIDLIDGKTADEIYAKAEKLANTKKRKPAYEKSAYETQTPVDIFGGRRGKPVTPVKPDSAAGSEFFRDLIGRG